MKNQSHPSKQDNPTTNKQSSNECHENYHLSPAELGLWSFCRQISHDSGVFQIGCRRIAARFDSCGKSAINRLLDSLLSKGWAIVQRRKKRGHNGVWIPAELKILDHTEWAANHPGECKKAVERVEKALGRIGDEEETATACPKEPVPPADDLSQKEVSPVPSTGHVLSQNEGVPVPKSDSTCPKNGGLRVPSTGHILNIISNVISSTISNRDIEENIPCNIEGDCINASVGEAVGEQEGAVLSSAETEGAFVTGPSDRAAPASPQLNPPPGVVRLHGVQSTADVGQVFARKWNMPDPAAVCAADLFALAISRAGGDKVPTDVRQSWASDITFLYKQGLGYYRILKPAFDHALASQTYKPLVMEGGFPKFMELFEEIVGEMRQ
jgi:hypothetical protein